ncbi:MAG: SpoIIE family protein phosphatase [Miltoncostaeaceae bacterium]
MPAHPPPAPGADDRDRLAGAVRASVVGMVLSDEDDRLVLANPAAGRLLGVDLGLLAGARMDDLIDEPLRWRLTNPADSAAAMRRVRRSADPEGSITLNVVDGPALRHRCVEVRDGGGRPLGRLDTFADITEARTALAALRREVAERERLARREELRAAEAAALEGAGLAMAGALAPGEVHARLIEQVRALVPHADKVAVLIADRRGALRVASQAGFAPATTAHMVFAPGEGAVGRVIAGKRPFICNDTATEPRTASRITRPEGIRSFMHIPLVVAGVAHGLVAVNSLRPRAFGEREVRVVGELALHAAAALQNALRYESERHVAATLQRALAPGPPPRIDGLAAATVHRPARGVRVGGDICMVWEAGAGRAAALIGDVAGQGIEAAGLASMVRHMAVALARSDPAPARLVAELDALVGPRLPDGALVTLAYVLADPGAGRLTWSTAGHPAPVLLRAGGEVVTLGEPGPPCGAFPDTVREQHGAPLGDGDTLVLYTDGLIEARRGRREFGDGSLHALLGSLVHMPAPELPGAVIAAVERWAGAPLGDDAAIAVLRRQDAGTARARLRPG